MMLVDVGNTRVKWTRAEGTRVGAMQAAVHADWSVDDWERALFDGPPVDRVVLASVAGVATRRLLEAAALRRGHARLEFVGTTAEACGVRNAYRDPALLGVDRWVAVIGAHHLRPGRWCCVADIGTAATVDVVTAAGEHRGGFIVPGPGLMAHSLLGGTSDLAAHAAASRPAAGALLADNTREAIERGCLVALAALVDRVHAEAGRDADATPSLLLTGGGAREVGEYVLTPVEIVPDLVLHGLLRIAQDRT